MKRQTEKKDGIYYMIDCLGGSIAGEIMKSSEIAWYQLGERRDLTEDELKNLAADLEGDLYRYTFKNGEKIEQKLLRECFY